MDATAHRTDAGAARERRPWRFPIIVSLCVHVAAAGFIGGFKPATMPEPPARPVIEVAMVVVEPEEQDAPPPVEAAPAPAGSATPTPQEPPKPTEPAPVAVTPIPQASTTLDNAPVLAEAPASTPLAGGPGVGVSIEPQAVGRAMNGGGTNEVKVVGLHPRVVVRVDPPYPAAARRRHLTGEVLLVARVVEDGKALSVSVKHSSGHSILDNAALDTVRQSWVFEAARENDHPVPADLDLPFIFRREAAL